MGRIHKKKYTEINVYERTLQRIEYLFSVYDDVVVSFSGGKDSTAMLLCTIDVARKLGRLPVKAVFYDEEAIHPTTIEYVERVRNMPEVDLEWWCLPIQHRNACSNEQPFWHCWHPKEKDIWVRDMPDCALTEHPRFEWGMSMQDFGLAHWKNTNKVVIQGIRTEESIRRYRVVARKKEDNYLSTPTKGVFFAYPIYDWSSTDVWNLVKVKNADYNKTYDIFNRTDLHEHFLTQRVCPPFGEEPLRGLHMYAVCFPEMWHKMINRVKGAATAARYGNTELYSQGFKPEDVDWRKHIENILESFSGQDRADVSDALNRAIKAHQRRTNDPIPESDGHPLTGCSWKFLSKMVTRGDFKGRVIQTMTQQGEKSRQKLGITLAEAESIYGIRNVRQQ
jgi:predicted phosphoadenosine phosphosulfate sulfurtransferase